MLQIRKLRRPALKTALALLSVSLLTAAKPPSVDSIREWQQRTTRVRTIGERLLSTNLETCSAKRNDFGMATAAFDPNASPEMRTAWQEAINLKDGSNVIGLSPGGPAQLAGISAGDVIEAIGDTHWSGGASSQKTFAEAMHEAEIKGSATFTIAHGADSRIIALKARSICDATVILAMNRPGSNAWSSGKAIFVENGLEKLLSDDAELAFVIAHEAAHVFLGHSADEAKADLRDKTKREQMEIDADKLAVHLMARAGYDPDAAARAHPKIDRANRGPLSRLFDIRGPYLSVKDRTALLAAEAQIVKRETGTSTTTAGTQPAVPR